MANATFHWNDPFLLDQQLSDDERSQIESALGELRSTLENQSSAAEEIRSKMEAVITASQALAQRIYQQAADQPAGEDSSGVEDEGIVEAEIVDEGEEEQA